MQQVAAISMKVMVLCFVSHKVMTTPIPCVCFGDNQYNIVGNLTFLWGWEGGIICLSTPTVGS